MMSDRDDQTEGLLDDFGQEQAPGSGYRNHFSAALELPRDRLPRHRAAHLDAYMIREVGRFRRPPVPLQIFGCRHSDKARVE